MSRNERRRRRKRRAAARKAALIALILAGMAFVSTALNGGKGDTAKEELEPAEARLETAELVKTSAEHLIPELENVCIRPEESPSQKQEEDPMKPEDVVAELVAQGYYRDDVPLDYELQGHLHLACQEAGVPYALALAVIQKETHFQNLLGDDGASEGYMQVQRKWHYDRMERLGVTDLMDPAGNFRVGCDFLAELLGKYPTQEALTAYNSGSPGYNKYSYMVMGYYEEWKELVGDGVSGIKSDLKS